MARLCNPFFSPIFGRTKPLSTQLLDNLLRYRIPGNNIRNFYLHCGQIVFDG